MTHNQVAYLEYLERVRSNQAAEAENKRWHEMSADLGYVQSENALAAASLNAGAAIYSANTQREVRMAELEQTRTRDLNNYNVGVGNVFVNAVGSIMGSLARLLH